MTRHNSPQPCTFCAAHAGELHAAGCEAPRHCLRANGVDERAWFNTVEEASAIEKSHPDYRGDIVVLCRCGFFHLSRPDWNLSSETPVEKLVVN